MVIHFFSSCFILGLIAASPGGPVCMLVLNRSVRRGFWAGVFTGLGAAVADAAYALLGFAGLLGALPLAHWLMPWLYGGGGIVLSAVGVSLMVRVLDAPSKSMRVSRLTSMLVQGFTLTIINPLVALFFMTTGMQMLSLYASAMTTIGVVAGAFFVGVGSTCVFIITSLFGALLSAREARSRMLLVQRVTGFILVCLGIGMIAHACGTIPHLHSISFLSK